MVPGLLALSLLSGSLAPGFDQSGLNDFALRLQSSIHFGVEKQLQQYFAAPDRDLPYLMAMGQRSGGLKTLRVVVIPSAPAWQGWGHTWAVIHTFQDCEQDHDMVMEVVKGSDGYKLGREIPIWENGGAKVKTVNYHATLHPEAGTIDVAAVLDVTANPTAPRPIFRLNDIYKIKQIEGAPNIATADSGTLEPGPNTDFVRAGGVLIPWKPLPTGNFSLPDHAAFAGQPNLSGQLSLKYSADIAHAREQHTDDQDLISTKEAVVASLWIPSLGQLPCPVYGAITAPKDWVIRGEGTEGKPTLEGDTQTSAFSCTLPISFPKIIGGKYTKTLESTQDGDLFRIYQLEPNDKEAQNTMDRMLKAAQFYKDHFGPLPFHGYDVYFSLGYYGIESYSHTILQSRDWFEVSHELGHTYFGGLGPCTYVHDTWNEGITQYVDSIVLHNDEDKSLELGVQTMNINIPLTKFFVPWSYENATYTRGAYVMRMLEEEIGRDKVLAGLHDIVQDRVGKDTTWDDLRPYFEKTGVQDLKWFWRQWVDAATYPTLTVTATDTVQVEKRFRTHFTVRQSGTTSPFRLRFKVTTTINGKTASVPVNMRNVEETGWIDTDERPEKLSIDTFPTSLCKKG